MTVLANDVIELEPQTCLEVDNPVFSIQLEGVTTVANDATLAMYVYRGSSDLSATSIVTGSMSRTNGPPAIVTLKTLQNLKIGEYVITVVGTMDGVLQGRQFRLYVRGKSGKQ